MCYKHITIYFSSSRTERPVYHYAMACLQAYLEATRHKCLGHPVRVVLSRYAQELRFIFWPIALEYGLATFGVATAVNSINTPVH